MLCKFILVHQLKIGLYWSVLGANINAQTEETQETALTLACCGGFLEVADFLIKAGADIELGCSTPLMEAAQEGHLELVKYLLAAGEALLWMYFLTLLSPADDTMCSHTFLSVQELTSTPQQPRVTQL